MTNRRNIFLLLFLIISHQGEFTDNTTGMGDTFEASWYDATRGFTLNSPIHQITIRVHANSHHPHDSFGQSDRVLELSQGSK